MAREKGLRHLVPRLFHPLYQLPSLVLPTTRTGSRLCSPPCPWLPSGSRALLSRGSRISPSTGMEQQAMELEARR